MASEFLKKSTLFIKNKVSSCIQEHVLLSNYNSLHLLNEKQRGHIHIFMLTGLSRQSISNEFDDAEPPSHATDEKCMHYHFNKTIKNYLKLLAFLFVKNRTDCLEDFEVSFFPRTAPGKRIAFEIKVSFEFDCLITMLVIIAK